jgi:hypothetical protein
MIEDDEDILAVATTGDANTSSDLQYLPLPNSSGWYAHFDHKEGSIELGRSTMLAATAPTVGSDVLLIPAQWQQKPRSGGPCDATLNWRWTGGHGVRATPAGWREHRDSRRNDRWFATRLTPYRYDPLDNLQQFTIHSASA